MKALKTILATAVIVFTLTAVATAGVHRLGDRAGDRQPVPQKASAAGRQSDTVKLSAQQSAALLKATGDATRERAARAERTYAKTHQHSRTHTHATVHDGDEAQPSGAGLLARSGSCAGRESDHAGARGHDADARHTVLHTQTHGGSTHDGLTHETGTHGGCD
jgi:hypothetical protein